jgi:hypothetical protein
MGVAARGRGAMWARPCCSFGSVRVAVRELLYAREGEKEEERRGKRKGRKRKEKKEKIMKIFPNLKISKK